MSLDTKPDCPECGQEGECFAERILKEDNIINFIFRCKSCGHTESDRQEGKIYGPNKNEWHVQCSFCGDEDFRHNSPPPKTALMS